MMEKTQIIAMCNDWQAKCKAVCAQIELLQTLTNGIDGPLQCAIWDMHDAYTKTLGNLIGDQDGFWLEWWAIECRFGEKPREASTTHTAPLHLIDSIELLVGLIVDRHE